MVLITCSKLRVCGEKPASKFRARRPRLMSIRSIVSTLEQLGASPRKSFGQNFLHDKNMAKWIVDQLAIQAGDHIVEIGPGLGALTANFSQSGVSATLLEKDKLFAEFVENTFSGDRMRVVKGDPLEYAVRDFVRLV